MFSLRFLFSHKNLFDEIEGINDAFIMIESK